MWMEVTLLIVLLVAVTALLAVAVLSAQQRQMQCELLEYLRLLQMDITAIRSGPVAARPRMQDSDNAAPQKQQERALAPMEQGYAPYSQATQLLNAGAGIDDLMRHCGITRAEAELMRLMHRQMKRRGSHPW